MLCTVGYLALISDRVGYGRCRSSPTSGGYALGWASVRECSPNSRAELGIARAAQLFEDYGPLIRPALETPSNY